MAEEKLSRESSGHTCAHQNMCTHTHTHTHTNGRKHTHTTKHATHAVRSAEFAETRVSRELVNITLFPPLPSGPDTADTARRVVGHEVQWISNCRPVVCSLPLFFFPFHCVVRSFSRTMTDGDSGERVDSRETLGEG